MKKKIIANHFSQVPAPIMAHICSFLNPQELVNFKEAYPHDFNKAIKFELQLLEKKAATSDLVNWPEKYHQASIATAFLCHNGFANGVNERRASDGLTSVEVAIETNASTAIIKGLFHLGFNINIINIKILETGADGIVIFRQNTFIFKAKIAKALVERGMIPQSRALAQRILETAIYLSPIDSCKPLESIAIALLRQGAISEAVSFAAEMSRVVEDEVITYPMNG